MSKMFQFAWQALRQWRARHIAVALVTAVIVGVVIGIATVLIPNPIFSRDIPPVWWNYPVWILTSGISGMLAATYVRSQQAETESNDRHGKLGMVGGFLAWFAVGCPVCNKLALLAFGYSGAISYFAPIQPVLGIGALVLTAIALLWRLKGQVLCTVPIGSQERAGTPADVETRV